VSKAKELLTELQSLDMDIQSRIDEINELEAGLLSSPKWTDVKVQNGQVRKIDDVYAQLITMKQEIERDIKEIIDRKLELSRLINKLSNPKYRTVLRMTYINKMYVDDICDKMEISRTTFYTWRGLAISELNDLLNRTKSD
jgi:DNA-directed RNA polymerase specialized sigma24 family protein